MTMADPVFVKYSDASNNETMHILLFDIVNEGVRIQRYRSVFNIYEGVRPQLIEHGIVINNNIIKVYPYDETNNTI